MSLTSMLALLLAISAVVFSEYVSKKIDTENQLILVSDIIAWNASAALTFKDITTAEEMLKGLENIGSILSAKLYDSNGNLFAAYQSDKSESDIFSQEYILNAVQNKEKTDYEYNLLQLIPKNIQTWFVTAESADYQIQNSKIYELIS